MRYFLSVNIEFRLYVGNLSLLFLKISGRNICLCFLLCFLSDLFKEVWYLLASILVVDFIDNDEVGAFDVLRYLPVALKPIDKLGEF